MKLRNMMLMASSIAVCATALADNGMMTNSGAMAKGGTYVGLAGGWGKLDSDTRTMDTFGQDTNTKTGGFGGRIYLGYLTPITSNLLFGPELGYSTYANNTYDSHSESTNDAIDVNVKESAYGVDLLANITYMVNNALNIAVKPGFQYGFQKVTNDDHYGEFFNSDKSVQDSKILPEINLEVNWQAFANQPFFIGASYQYVFGDDARGNLYKVAYAGYTAVTSRQMVALNLEYLF